MKKLILITAMLLITVLVNAQTLTINAQGLPIGTNPIVTGSAGSVIFEIKATMEWTITCDASPLNNGAYYARLSKTSGIGNDIITVTYEANPFNAPFCFNFFLSAKSDPMHIYVFAYIMQAVGAGTIDMIGNQLAPDIVIPNYPVGIKVPPVTQTVTPAVIKKKGRK